MVGGSGQSAATAQGAAVLMARPTTEWSWSRARSPLDRSDRAYRPKVNPSTRPIGLPIVEYLEDRRGDSVGTYVFPGQGDDNAFGSFPNHWEKIFENTPLADRRENRRTRGRLCFSGQGLFYDHGGLGDRPRSARRRSNCSGVIEDGRSAGAICAVARWFCWDIRAIGHAAQGL